MIIPLSTASNAISSLIDTMFDKAQSDSFTTCVWLQLTNSFNALKRYPLSNVLMVAGSDTAAQFPAMVVSVSSIQIESVSH